MSSIDLTEIAGPHGLSWLQNARLLRMTRSGGPRTNASGPTHPDYRALFDLGLVAVGSTKYPHPQHWLRLTNSAPIRAWEAELTEKEKACLAVAYAYIEEEYTNLRLVTNGFPEKQTYVYVGRSHYQAPEAAQLIPAPEPVAPPKQPAPGTQFDLFGMEVARG